MGFVFGSGIDVFEKAEGGFFCARGDGMVGDVYIALFFSRARVFDFFLFWRCFRGFSIGGLDALRLARFFFGSLFRVLEIHTVVFESLF